MKRISNEAGSVWGVLIILILFIWVSIASILSVLASQYETASRAKMSAAALYVAEGGARKALWELSRGRAGYSAEAELDLDVGVASVETRSENGRLVVTATGYVPDKRHPRASQAVRVEAVKDAKSDYHIAAWHRL